MTSLLPQWSGYGLEVTANSSRSAAELILLEQMKLHKSKNIHRISVSDEHGNMFTYHVEHNPIGIGRALKNGSVPIRIITTEFDCLSRRKLFRICKGVGMIENHRENLWLLQFIDQNIASVKIYQAIRSNIHLKEVFGDNFWCQLRGAEIEFGRWDYSSYEIQKGQWMTKLNAPSGPNPDISQAREEIKYLENELAKYEQKPMIDLQSKIKLLEKEVQSLKDSFMETERENESLRKRLENV
jgi:hypothetical protein